MNTSFLRTVGAIFRKDLAVWLRNGRNIATTTPATSSLPTRAGTGSGGGRA